jgi:hypothetical protein
MEEDLAAPTYGPIHSGGAAVTAKGKGVLVGQGAGQIVIGLHFAPPVGACHSLTGAPNQCSAVRLA